MRLDTFGALAGATLVWLVALPSQAANNSPTMPISPSAKILRRRLAICRVEARAEPHD
jgi:hypothetical protein